MDDFFADPSYNLWILLNHTYDAIYRARNKELDRYGIHIRQAAIIFHIKAIGEKATIAEISRWLFREPHTIANTLKTLENHGLVKKTKSKNARTPMTFALTEKGEAAFEQIIKRESIHQAISALSEEDLKHLEMSLRKIKDQAMSQLIELRKPPLPFL